MSKYASLLFPATEYYRIGPFRFPVYHDLVPGEAKGIEEISRKQSRSTFASIKVAQRIAADKGISTKEAIELLSRSDEADQDFFYEYAAQLEELQRDTIGVVEQQVAFVTLFMQYRGEVKLPEAADWKRLEDWTEADTEAMPSKVLNEIFSLIGWERDGWPETNEVGKPVTQEKSQEMSPPLKKS